MHESFVWGMIPHGGCFRNVFQKAFGWTFCNAGFISEAEFQPIRTQALDAMHTDQWHTGHFSMPAFHGEAARANTVGYSVLPVGLKLVDSCQEAKLKGAASEKFG